MWSMTGEVPPGTGAGSGAQPELRASYEDRDRTVEILRVAAGDGRLTAAELDERVEAALTARTSGELAALTADLPAVPGQATRSRRRPIGLAWGIPIWAAVVGGAGS
jgi:hypothetical protein